MRPLRRNEHNYQRDWRREQESPYIEAGDASFRQRLNSVDALSNAHRRFQSMYHEHPSFGGDSYFDSKYPHCGSFGPGNEYDSRSNFFNSPHSSYGAYTRRRQNSIDSQNFFERPPTYFPEIDAYREYVV